MSCIETLRLEPKELRLVLADPLPGPWVTGLLPLCRPLKRRRVSPEDSDGFALVGEVWEPCKLVQVTFSGNRFLKSVSFSY
jgi:hypothetical protein